MGLRRAEIRSLVESHGHGGFLKIMKNLLEGGEAPDGRKLPKRKPSDFSIRALWEGLVGPVEDTLQYAKDQAGLIEMPVELEEQVSTGAFPSAVGQLINAEVIEGYETTDGFIGDQLVRTMPSKLRGESVVGFTTLQSPKEVLEGQAYEDSSFAEKTVGTRETKRGRLISVTEELVFFDQTGQVLDRARTIGELARQDRERRIVQGVIDHDSGNAIYQPNGTAEQLYSSGNNNVDTAIGALADWTDIQEVMDFHANNITDDRQADDTDGAQPLVFRPRILLTSLELAGVAARIVGATIATSGGVESPAQNILRNILNGGTLMALSSPFINSATGGDQWDDNSDWFLGDFQKQFRYKEIWPLQTFRAPAQNPEQFHRDIVAQFKVREYGDVLAIDERWVIKVDVA